MLSFFTKILDSHYESQKVNIALLIFRIGIGLSLINTHGLPKLMDIQGAIEHIPDPFGMGGTISVIVAITANIVCASFLVLGLFTRFSALFIMGLTLTGLFMVHWADPWKVKDVPYMYSLANALIIMLGAGKYSMDNYLHTKLISRKN